MVMNLSIAFPCHATQSFVRTMNRFVDAENSDKKATALHKLIQKVELPSPLPNLNKIKLAFLQVTGRDSYFSGHKIENSLKLNC